MKIAIVSSLFPPFAVGGAEEAACTLALALRDLGHEVHVISTCASNAVPRNGYRLDMWQGLPVWRIAPRNVYWSYEKQQKRPGAITRTAWHAIDLWNPSIRSPLQEVLGRIRPDVVNTHNIDGFSPEVWRTARNFTQAIAHTLHDCHLLCPRATMIRSNGSPCENQCGLCSLYSRFNLLFQDDVRALVAPSAAIARRHRDYGWRPPLMRVIRNSVEARPAGPYTTARGPLRVLFLSRLEREKGCGTLLSVVERFRGSEEICFHVAGRGSFENRFAQVSREAPNVMWHGFVSGSDKFDLLSRADVFLQISECAENAPLGLIEAKRFGLYAVGSNLGGIPELIDAQEAGELVPAGDADRLALSLRYLTERKEEIRNGREERSRRALVYGTREMAEQYVTVFDQILAPREGVSNAMTKPAMSHG